MLLFNYYRAMLDLISALLKRSFSKDRALILIWVKTQMLVPRKKRIFDRLLFQADRLTFPPTLPAHGPVRTPWTYRYSQPLPLCSLCQTDSDPCTWSVWRWSSPVVHGSSGSIASSRDQSVSSSAKCYWACHRLEPERLCNSTRRLVMETPWLCIGAGGVDVS